MTDIMRYELETGTVLVEVDDDSVGMGRVSRDSNGVMEAGRRLEDALSSVREAAKATLESLTGLAPEKIEVEFGIKLAGEIGALIAKGSTEGHFKVKMSWSAGTNPGAIPDTES